MSWLSSLFKGKKTSQPDTSAAEAEAKRQAELEQQRLQAQLDQQQKMWEQQRADDQARAAAQLKAQQDEAERQRQLAQAHNDQQFQLQQTQLQSQEDARKAQEAKAEQERQAQAAQATQHAQQARDYATGRQGIIDQGKAGIDQAFSGFNDKTFGDFAQSFVDYYKPQAEKNYADATKDTTFGYADTHNLRSSAAANSFGDLVGQLHTNEGKIASGASDAAQQYRSQIDQQKSDALSMLYQSAGAANPNLPDGFTDTDVSSALGGLSSQIGGITSSAAARAQGTKAPSFTNSNLDLSMRAKKPTGVAVIG